MIPERITLFPYHDKAMRDKLLEGKNTPLSECIPEEEIHWEEEEDHDTGDHGTVRRKSI